MAASLPKKCFISYSYRDKAHKEQLLGILPPHVEPFLFPPITVTPDEMVTNDLILNIVDCEGMVYIDDDWSARSFWVAFERDFAKRVNLPVFAFHPATSTITLDESAPLHLPAFPSSAARDRERVDQILACMRDERFFDVFTANDLKPGALLVEELGHAMSSRLRAGGYVVAFLSEAAVSSLWVRREIESAVKDFGDRVLFAWLDRPMSLPHDLPMPASQWLVLHRIDDESRLNWNEVDRLIVMLYWLIYRNTKANELH